MTRESITHEIHVDASPEIVFDVITSPEHILEWWNGAETGLSATPGQVTEIAWGRESPEPHVETLTVVDADPHRLFSFRWVADGGAPATAENSLLATFELVPTGSGTTIRFSETGYQGKDWSVEELEATYASHEEGWARFVPSVADYAGRLATAS
ncbi:SRPBCC domain-containing protein [Patulibacter minatonensis]|uniref:SRPBCC domain-containing protein n=1 Tax=Patulibacter minatonensis TaxID=298163 RepID=UPI00047C2B26|nr:SRPBCC domain-containing protein [Patulibacter minatonensis]